ncbi:hypothetical protein ASPVEDRAFT_88892 [Aspergillus versicolor CBS 583.65]|uniref:Zn(2)-C6 fungal-type domain-containing protein n=1 Tax=Aspergillus versicolor CBS 583.65 TaxID=1036611 RepID=A0A1L9Q1K7_ASPVE|nr:uncharacterized protein ASPVEDRAFT_88892 [Aspergillus versicolor CBS 583.65]OJJ07653.1 hypothetical protein ASPVEDRAFT_88892 [Aspergillus versicolor CBS 583.65]
MRRPVSPSPISVPVVSHALADDPNQKPFPCRFAGCAREFLRRDTALRHAKTCAHRDNKTPYRARVKGKPRSSCGSCALRKTACDGNWPCGSCVARGGPDAARCSYNRVTVSASSSSFSSGPSEPFPRGRIQRDHSHSHSPTHENEVGVSDDLLMATIPFLVNYYGINRSCSNLYLALEIGRPLPDLSISPGCAPSSLYPYRCNNNAQESSEEVLADFTARGAEILETLRITATTCSLSSSSSSTTTASTALETAATAGIFSSASIDRLARFCIYRLQRHFPFVHRPTFCVATASIPLLLAMILAGCVVDATYESPLPVPSDRATSAVSRLQLAVDCFDIAEDFIFRLPLFNLKDLAKSHIHSHSQTTTIETDTLMAAIIVVSLQIGRNDNAIRRRLRRLRLPALADAARALGLFGVAHRDRGTRDENQRPRWGSTRLQEEIGIRLATSIFLLDCQLTGCTSATPYIAVEELTRDLPCSESSFIIITELSTMPSLLEGPSSIADIPVSLPTVTLSETIHILVAEADAPPGDEASFWLQLRGISILGLFTVVAGMFSRPSQYQHVPKTLITWRTFHRTLTHSTPLPGIYCLIFTDVRAGRIATRDSYKRAMFHRALDRWRLLWKDLLWRSEIHELDLVGYVGCAEELWLLSRVLLQLGPTDVRDMDSSEAEGEDDDKGELTLTLTVPLCEIRRTLAGDPG